MRQEQCQICKAILGQKGKIKRVVRVKNEKGDNGKISVCNDCVRAIVLEGFDKVVEKYGLRKEVEKIN